MSTPPDTLTFHAQHPAGGEAYVVLLYPPDAAGRVAYREWPSTDWAAPGRDGVASADELAERVEGWRRARWTFSEPVERIHAWLARR